MRGLITIYRRELAGMFFGPLAWILLSIALLLSGLDFVATLQQTGGNVTFSLQASFGALGALIFLPPLLTMRMISEESRSGMLEFLLTAPVTDRAVIGGKFLAALSFMALFWTTKLVYAATIAALGTPPDWSATLGVYIGTLLTSGLFCAIGLLASAATGTPMLAAFLGLIANIGVLVFPRLGEFVDVGLVERAAEFVDMRLYFESFLRGVIDTGAVAFFLIWTGMLLFLATRTVEAHRWR